MTPQEKVESLEKELAELREWLSLVDAKTARLREIVGYWHNQGDLKQARLEVRDSAFPIFKNGSGWGVMRIVAVDSKWISLREDGREDDAVTRYNRETARRERTRTDYDKIDIAKALAIWAEHQTQHSTPPNATGEKV